MRLGNESGMAETGVGLAWQAKEALHLTSGLDVNAHPVASYVLTTKQTLREPFAERSM
jgi:hypothetical protein